MHYTALQAQGWRDSVLGLAILPLLLFFECLQKRYFPLEASLSLSRALPSSLRLEGSPSLHLILKTNAQSCSTRGRISVAVHQAALVPRGLNLRRKTQYLHEIHFLLIWRQIDVVQTRGHLQTHDERRLRLDIERGPYLIQQQSCLRKSKSREFRGEISRDRKARKSGASIAQLVEHPLSKRKVESSILP